MKNYLLIIACLCFVMSSQLRAQSRSVSGTVTSEQERTPVPGVNVVLKGTVTGTVTDLDGRFQLSVPESGGTLVFSFLGFVTEEVFIGTQSVINMVMTADIRQLSEVVVVGYGEQNRRDLTGSVASVKGDDINKLPVASMDAALQGRAAGVLVTTPSGTPGAGINIQVRGLTSLSASSQPLFVIDGVPMIQEDLSGLFSGGQATNSLADINPADIASIEILKDASATAIYGSRGANGVVLITTKRGQTGKAKIDFNAYYGMQDVTKRIDMMNSGDFLRLMDEAAAQDNRFLGRNYPDNYVSDIWGFDPDDPDLQNTRWYNEIFRPAPIQSYDLSVSGGSDVARYFASGSYFKQDGVQPGTGFERLSGRINLDAKVNNWIDVGTSMMLSRTVQDRTINDNSLYGVVINTLAGDPLMPVYEADGSYADPFDYFGWWMLDNPLLIANEYQRFTNTTRGLATAFAELKLAKGLTFKSTASIDYTQLDDEAYTPSISREAGNRNVKGFGVYGNTQDFTWLAENFVTYSTKFGERHSLNAVAGTSFQQSTRNFVSINAEEFPNDEFLKLAVAANVTSASTSATQWGIASYFARVNYGFDDKYLFTFTARADGSSRFGADRRYGFFPSGSFAWRLGDEVFLRDIDVLSDAKLRVSYGVTGNQDGIGNFASRGLFSATAAYRQQPAFVPSQLPNPLLTWESTEQFNIGLDVGFANDRITFTADYFVSNTKDLLLNRLVRGLSGFKVLTDNIGSVENRGLELAANAVILTGDFRWSTSANISWIRNTVKKLEVDEQVLSDSHILAEGHPIGTFFLIDQEGVDPETGNIRWVDLNEDGAINSGDRRIVGNALPDFFGGFNNSFSYKGFDMTVFFQFTVGNTIFNHSRASYENLGWSRIGTGFPLPDGNNWTGAENRWREPGDVTDIPRASLENVNWREYSSRWLEDGSFLRLKNINLGYTFPNALVERMGLQSLRVYLQGQNLLTFTKYTGLDPEVNQNARDPRVAGSDFGTHPQLKSVSLGFNIGL
ncbi:MAG: TonB-dependent receptor [Cyclobacteriaceae bacterium]|nr:TonB-dependent receptor [Cyclobacteriaceae bacterium]